MKLVLSVRNDSNLIKPSRGDVILYNGSEWYVTKKDDLLAECKEALNSCQNQLDSCRQELSQLKAENANFKKEVASQIYELSELIKKLYSK